MSRTFFFLAILAFSGCKNNTDKTKLTLEDSLNYYLNSSVRSYQPNDSATMMQVKLTVERKVRENKINQSLLNAVVISAFVILMVPIFKLIGRRIRNNG